MQTEKRAEMAAQAKIRIGLTFVPPWVPCSGMEVEELGQGGTTGTDEGVSAREQPFKANITDVIYGEDIDNPYNLPALKHNKDTTLLSQLEDIDSESIRPNLGSMSYDIKEPDLVRYDNDKGSLEEFNSESNSGDPGRNELSIKPAPIQCNSISNEKTLPTPT